MNPAIPVPVETTSADACDPLVVKAAVQHCLELSVAGLRRAESAPAPPVLLVKVFSPRVMEGPVSPLPEKERASLVEQAKPLLLPLAGPASDNPAPEPSRGAPFADLLPFDVEAAQRRVDAFFERLAELSEEWTDGQLLDKLAPWCMAATVVIYEWARRRRRGSSWRADGGDSGPETTAFLMGDEP
jgi:hypothetical protein